MLAAAPDQPWVIQRKPNLKKQQEVQQIVYDDSLPPTKLLQAGAEEPLGAFDSQRCRGGHRRLAGC